MHLNFVWRSGANGVLGLKRFAGFNPCLGDRYCRVVRIRRVVPVRRIERIAGIKLIGWVQWFSVRLVRWIEGVKVALVPVTKALVTENW